MRLEHLLSGADVFFSYFRSVVQERGLSFFPSSCACAALYGGLAQLARAPALQAGGQRFESVILHESLFGIEIFDILTHKTVVLNQKIRYFTSENQSLRVLRHSQTYVAIIQ